LNEKSGTYIGNRSLGHHYSLIYLDSVYYISVTDIREKWPIKKIMEKLCENWTTPSASAVLVGVHESNFGIITNTSGGT
jgi:hypothetical protein